MKNKVGRPPRVPGATRTSFKTYLTVAEKQDANRAVRVSGQHVSLSEFSRETLLRETRRLLREDGNGSRE